ncbi:MAG: hypothetical protein C0524_18450 [Rhodobacter sp.]|nr:hypothetical protein [Rhodobacter sp.]
MWSANRDMPIPFLGDPVMAGKREKPEDIVLKLRQVEVPQEQAKKGRLWRCGGSCVRLRPEHANHVCTSRLRSGPN